MNKNVQAILIGIAALLIVSFMYIGGLISDAKHDKANEKKEQLKVQTKENPENSSNTNLLIKEKEIKSTPLKEISSQSHSSSNVDVKKKRRTIAFPYSK